MSVNKKYTRMQNLLTYACFCICANVHLSIDICLNGQFLQPQTKSNVTCSNCWGLFPYCNSDISYFVPLPSTMKFGRSQPNIVRRRFYCVIIVNNMVDLVLVGNFCDLVCHKTPKTVDNGIPFVII